MAQAQVPAGSVVVGVDGSEHSERAVRWAARRARGEHRLLVLLHAAGPGASTAPGWMRSYDLDPGPEMLRVVEVTDPRTALLEASRTADTVVVGSRGTGPVRSLLLGSTSSAVVAAACCPVVVVVPDDGHHQRRGVVVGADGTPGSLPVIEYAVRAASLMRCPLTVMHAFWDVAGVINRGRHVSPDERDVEDLRVLLAESVAGIREKFPDVEVTPELSRGLVDECLADAGTTAELVVVGRHRRGVLSRLLSTTVTTAVLEHASCPVAVVPEADEDDCGPSPHPR